jgi:hypothetical protein
MKKALIVMFVLAGFSQAKAQQFFNPNPSDSLKNNSFDKYFNTAPGKQQQLLHLQANPLQTPAFVKVEIKVSNYDHMPIAYLPVNSKMPVIKLGGSYKMPVLKIGEDTLADLKKRTP